MAILLKEDGWERYFEVLNTASRRLMGAPNFGDCMAYALAKFHQDSLLFKGNDFIHTDITPALL